MNMSPPMFMLLAKILRNIVHFYIVHCKYSDSMKNMNFSNLGLKCGTFNIFSNIGNNAHTFSKISTRKLLGLPLRGFNSESH